MAELRIGVIGIPGKWSTETLADAIDARTGFRRVIDMAGVSLDPTGARLSYQGENLCDYDGLLVKKISQRYSPHSLDRVEMLRVAEQAGVRVFSRPSAILGLIDRLSGTVTLSNGGIPMPPTRITEDPQQAAAFVGEFGEAVFKPLYSTKADGMQVLSADREPAALAADIEAFQAINPVMYIQKKLALPGRDMGLVFLAGEYLGAYARVSGGDTWNTTIKSGGHYEGHQPDAGIVEIARRAQALFGLDFTTVDVAESEQGPVVFEVSAFGGFRGAKEGIGIDAAGLYAEHAIRELSS